MTIATPYNHTAKLILGQEVSITDLKCMLINNATAFSAAHTTVAQASNSGANEISGNGWPAGGQAFAAEAATIVATNGAMLDATDISVLAVGGPIGPALRALILDSISNLVLWNIDFEMSKQADETTNFVVTLSGLGLARLTWA